MVKYKPYEQQQLDALLPALRQGMDPTTALGLFQGVQSGALERAAQQKAYRDQMMTSMFEQAQGLASSGARPAGLNALMESYQDIAPGLNKPRYEQRFEGLKESLYPGDTKVSPLYMPEPGQEVTPQTATALDAETAAGVWADARAAAQGSADMPPVSLHQARMAIIGGLKAQGYGEQVTNEVYDMIGKAYQSVPGSMIGDTPLTLSGYRNSLQPTGESMTPTPEPTFPAQPFGGRGVPGRSLMDLLNQVG